VNGSGDRWILPDLQSALRWSAKRNGEGIRCVLDVLGEYAGNEREAAESVEACLSCLQAIRDHGLDASLSVKTTALGATFDHGLAREHVLALSREAARLAVGLEIDMEGRGLVVQTLEIAVECARQGRPPALALQAYLNRTPGDLHEVIKHRIRPRIVKGAYIGDTGDPYEIRRRFVELVLIAHGQKAPFAVGTHDPDLIGWLVIRFAETKESLEFGFLKGLSNITKIALAERGWPVAEYVPFGSRRAAYEARRRRYLQELHRLGRKAAS